MTNLMSLHPWYVLFIGMCVGSEIGIHLHYLLTYKLNLHINKRSGCDNVIIRNGVLIK